VAFWIGYTCVDYSRARPSAWVTVLMAGWAAEEVITGARVKSRPHAGSDQDEIAAALAQVSPGQRNMLLTAATQQCKTHGDGPSPSIICLAGALLEKSAMTGNAWDGWSTGVEGDQL
jgi:hypothetical protein